MGEARQRCQSWCQSPRQTRLLSIIKADRCLSQDSQLTVVCRDGRLSTPLALLDHPFDLRPTLGSVQRPLLPHYAHTILSSYPLPIALETEAEPISYTLGGGRVLAVVEYDFPTWLGEVADGACASWPGCGTEGAAQEP